MTRERRNSRSSDKGVKRKSNPRADGPSAERIEDLNSPAAPTTDNSSGSNDQTSRNIPTEQVETISQEREIGPEKEISVKNGSLSENEDAKLEHETPHLETENDTESKEAKNQAPSQSVPDSVDYVSKKLASDEGQSASKNLEPGDGKDTNEGESNLSKGGDPEEDSDNRDDAVPAGGGDVSKKLASDEGESASKNLEPDDGKDTNEGESNLSKGGDPKEGSDTRGDAVPASVGDLSRKLTSDEGESASKNLEPGDGKEKNEREGNPSKGGDSEEDSDGRGDAVPAFVALGPNDTWFIRFADGTSAWDNIPEDLHMKLTSRGHKLPGVKHLSFSDNNGWVASFDDGSFTMSESCKEIVLNAFQLGGDASPADIVQFIFLPNRGTMILREDGEVYSERIPITLSELISSCKQNGLKIQRFCVSRLGGWFVQFDDDECSWKDLPHVLELMLSTLSRKGPNSIVLSLSPTDQDVYFISFGSFYSTTYKCESFTQTLEWMQKKRKDKPEQVTFVKMPPLQAESFSEVYKSYFEYLSGLANEVQTPAELSENLTPDDITSSSSAHPLHTPSGGAPESEISETSNAKFRSPGAQSMTAPDNLAAHGLSSILSSFTSIFGHHRASRGNENSKGEFYTSRANVSTDRDISSATSKQDEVVLKYLKRILKVLEARKKKLNSDTINKTVAEKITSSIEDTINSLAAPDLTRERILELQTDANFLRLYASGWLTATDPISTPIPWLDGWFQGHYGCERETVDRIMEKVAEARYKRLVDSEESDNAIENIDITGETDIIIDSEFLPEKHAE